MTKLISIVIATYNADPHIRVTLDSIANLSPFIREELEVLIIDGASSDKTIDIAREYGELVTQIISEPDDGIYDAMNKGASLASGSWLHFLNAGDRFTSAGKMNSLLDLLRRHAGELWAVSGAVNMGGQRGPTPIPNMPHMWWKHALGIQPHCHQACWFRTDAFRAIGGYSLEFGLADDFDLILRFGLLSVPLQVSEVLIEYQGGGISEKRRHEVPLRLHQIRSHRLALTGFLSYVDSGLANSIAVINQLRIIGGRMKASFFGTLTRSNQGT